MMPDHDGEFITEEFEDHRDAVRACMNEYGYATREDCEYSIDLQALNDSYEPWVFSAGYWDKVFGFSLKNSVMSLQLAGLWPTESITFAIPGGAATYRRAAWPLLPAGGGGALLQAWQDRHLDMPLSKRLGRVGVAGVGYSVVGAGSVAAGAGCARLRISPVGCGVVVSASGSYAWDQWAEPRVFEALGLDVQT
jgi:hypothetical protein